MQRVNSPRGPRSSTKPPGVGESMSTPCRVRSTSTYHRSAAGVSGGTRPSAGSITSDVCGAVRLASVQNRL